MFSEEPMLSVQPRGFGRFVVSGQVPEFRDPALRFESRAGDVTVPLDEDSSAADAVRALERRLPRGIYARTREGAEGLELTLNETVIPAAKPPFVQIFSTDLKQRVRRLDDNRFELSGPTGSDCLITLGIETRRVIVPVLKGTSARRTAEKISDRVPSGYRATVERSVISIWKDADLRTIAA